MAGIIDRVTTADRYGTTAQTGCIQNMWTGKGGNYTIANASVFYQLQYGGLGDDYWTDEAYSGPSTGIIPPGCTGIRFRSYATGVAAVVFASIAEGKEPTLSGQQFAGTVSVSGQVIPPSLNVQIQHNGALVSTEPIVNFIDSFNSVFTVTDNVPNTRANISLSNLLGMIGATARVVNFGDDVLTWPGGTNNTGKNVTHGLGVTPLAAWIIAAGGGGGGANLSPIYLTDTFGAVTFRALGQTIDLSAPALNVTAPFHWLAIG